ncbi:MAG TPA: DinB family protein [Gemmatimonadaceae bacterium]|nr:DinB family protein [Gemmatimonadaceae bacterium]
MRTRRLSITLALLAAFPGLARAQTKQQMIDDWQRQRANVLAYLDAMPDSAMAFRPTPGVRDFAQQIEHAVTTDLLVAALALRGESNAPFTLDTTQMHQKAVLRDYTDRTYGYVLESIRFATPAQLLTSRSIFNQPAQSAARWLSLAYEHAVWTLGQTVPYLRLNGVTPPEYRQPL